MKYIIAILISCAFAFPAFVAKTVQGTVPHPPPLQLPAAGVSPNYSHNIESRGRTVPDQVGNPAGTQQSSKQPGTAGGSEQSGSAPIQSSSNHLVFWLIIAAVLAGGFGFWLWRRKKFSS